MREIKFRAWDKTNRWMDEGVFVRADGAIYTDGVIAYDTPNTEIEEVKKGEFIIMQFTGLTDRNGKEIYEGDIVRCKTGYHEYITVVRIGEYYQDGSGNEYPSVKCYGVYGEEAYDTRGGYVQVSSINENESIEVLGNEYEHPHLIEGVK